MIKRLNNAGYIEIKKDSKWMLEHKKVAQEVLGRELEHTEIIHHINLDKKDNRPENLALFNNQQEHIKFHLKLRQFGLTNPLKRQLEEIKLK